MTAAFAGSNPASPVIYGALAQLVEHLTFNQVVRGSNPRCFISGNLIRFPLFLHADMAELADAPDLGSGVHDVQVQVLLSAD